MLIAEILLYIDVTTLEDNILKWQCFTDEFIRVLFGEVGDVDYGEVGGFLR